jgi:hypothetical protein
MVSKWHRDIQPIIDNDYSIRADCGWNWPSVLRVLPMSIRFLVRKKPLGFVLIAPGPENLAVPIGICIGIEPWMCLRGTSVLNPYLDFEHGYAWYLTGIPREVCAKFGLPPLRVTPSVVEIFRILCDSESGAGRIVLHADEKGGDKLLSFYEVSCNLVRVPESDKVFTLVRRPNDGRFFRSEPLIER